MKKWSRECWIFVVTLLIICLVVGGFTAFVISSFPSDEKRLENRRDHYDFTYKAWMKANPDQTLTFQEWHALFRLDILPNTTGD